MNFQFDVTSPAPPPPPPTDPAVEQVELLRQLVDLQRQQLGFLQAISAAHDSGARWRSFINRWREDFPGLAVGCRDVLPVLERTYGKMMADLTEHLLDNGGDSLDNDFTLQEFLDKFGMKLAQLGTILNLVAPLAEAGSPSESS